MSKRRILSILLVAVLLLGLVACKDKKEEIDTDKLEISDKDYITPDIIKIGVVGDLEIWEPVKAELIKENIHIELINFSDYTLPNISLGKSEIHLNAFQHKAFLENYNKENKTDITAIGDTYLSAMNIYSSTLKNLDSLSSGIKIAIPNDITNRARALNTLHDAGVLKLNTTGKTTTEISDIKDNPHNIEFVEVDASRIPGMLDEVDLGVINSNYILDNLTDAIWKEEIKVSKMGDYVNVIAARKEDVGNPVYNRIVEVYQSKAVEEVYSDTYLEKYVKAW